MPYQSIYAGRSTATVPNSNKANPFADDFKPGQYLAKNQPKAQPKKADQPQPAPPPQPSIASKGGSILSKIGSSAKKITAPLARPIVDVATGKGGKAAHDTAQLSADVTGGAPNYLLKTAITNPVKELSAQASGNKKVYRDTVTQSNKDLGLGAGGKDIKHGLIKLGAETALTASNLVGGGEVKAATTGAKSLLRPGIASTVKVNGKPLITKGAITAGRFDKSMAIGATGNASATLANNPKASAKDVAKSAALGLVIGGAVPFAIKGAGKVGESAGKEITKLDDKYTGGVVTNGKATKDLITNAKTKSLLDASRAPKVVNENVATDATTKSVNSIMSKVRTPSKVIQDIKTQGEAATAKQAEAEKAAAETQKTVEANSKLDDKIELIKAKKADGKFTNVDKVKVKQLESQKLPVEVPAASPVATPTEGSIPKAGGAEPTQVMATPAPTNAIKSQPEPKVSTRQQTEINPNKAEPVNVALPKTPEPATPDIKTSKLANRVETIAIKKDLSSGFADKPEYAKVNMSKQAETAAALLKGDPERLQRIAMGHERPPEGLLPESAWVAAVHNAKKTGDAQALLDLGTKSHLVSEASGMGQRIRALGELDNGSPAKHIKDIADVGNKTFEKKTGQTFDKAVKQSVKEVKTATPAIKAKDWSSFVEALKC